MLRKRPNRVYVFLAIIVLAGLAVRLPLMPFVGTSDHHTWSVWAYAGATHSFADIYRVRPNVKVALTPQNVDRALHGHPRPAKWSHGGRAARVDYPPVIPVSLGLLGRIYTIFSPEFANSGALNALTKVPGLVADLFVTALVFFLTRPRKGDRVALVASALYWLNPMALLGGSLLAYQDPVYAAPLIVSILLFMVGRHALGWVAYVLAVATKPQALVVAPVLALASVARRSVTRLMGYGASAGATGLAVVLPFLLGGTMINLLVNVLVNAGEPYLSANNCNVWWLATYGGGVRDQMRHGVHFVSALRHTPDIANMPRLMAAGNPDPRPWALAFFALFTAGVLLTWWLRFGRSPQTRSGRSPALFELAALQLYGATMLLTQVHENHAYGAAALLGATWWLSTERGERLDRELLGIFLALSGVVFANMILFYGFGESLGERIVPRGAFWIDLTVLLSVLNLSLFAWWLWRWIRPLPVFNRQVASRGRTSPGTATAA